MLPLVIVGKSQIIIFVEHLYGFRMAWLLTGLVTGRDFVGYNQKEPRRNKTVSAKPS